MAGRKHVLHPKKILLLLVIWSSSISRGQEQDVATRGKLLENGKFLPGTMGREWTAPEPQDLTRLNSAQPNSPVEEWNSTSWAEVDCCRKLDSNAVWENEETGVPDCFCRDILQMTKYKTTSFCSLKQSCENALRDWNKVFGEGTMVQGEPVVWNTDSPARTCMVGSGDNWVVAPCGKKKDGNNWTDPFGRGLWVEGWEALQGYGEAPQVLDADPNTKKWRWKPGDVPEERKFWQGYQANDGMVQEGLLASNPVYPGTNHSEACLENATQESCLTSSFMTWTGPENAQQADCMFAVKRAICAYHFWECDKSYHEKIYNGVCESTCRDIPKLCGVIPSTGEPLELSQFTLGGAYYLGCTNKNRQYIKDCTADSIRTGPFQGISFSLVSLTLGISLGMLGR